MRASVSNPLTQRFGRGALGRRWWLISIGLLLVTGSIWLAVERSCRRVDSQRFLDLKGRLVRAEETPIEATDTHRTLDIVLEDDRGLQLLGRLRTPVTSSEPWPAFLILGGVRTGRRAIEYLPDFDNVVLLALDYPYAGKRSGLSVAEFAVALPAMRRAVLRTVPAAMLAVDYLLDRPDVDPDRVVLVAGSVGTLFAPAVAATDSRIAALVLLFGGGDIQSLLEHIAAEDLGLFVRPGAWLGKALTCSVEPLNYIAGVSPRPIFMLNGTDDLGIPEINTRLLFEAAHQPKTLRWIDAGHVLLQDPSFHRQVTDELLAWLLSEGLIDPE